jgi:hypothetical protein
MIRLFKFFLKLCIFVFIFFTSIDYFFLREKKVDLSNEPDFKKWVGITYEIKQDAFLYKQHDSLNFHLGMSQEKTWLPVDTEDYLSDFNRWKSIPNYVWHKERFQAIHLLILGTQFKITGIFRFERPLVGDYLAIEIVILDGPYEGHNAQAQALFSYNVEPYEIIEPKASLYQVVIAPSSKGEGF